MRGYAWNTRFKQSVINDVLNDSNILSRRIKEDNENKRILNYDSVLNDYYFINTKFLNKNKAN
jgi:hypothetical protein